MRLWIAALVVLAGVAALLGYRILTMKEASSPPAPPSQAGAPAQPAPPVASPPPPQQPPAKPVSPGALRQQFPPTRVERPFEPVRPPARPPPVAIPEARPPRPQSPPPTPAEPEPALPIPPEPTPPSPPLYRGPSAGTLIWSGQIESNTLVAINGDRVNFGRLTGELPGVPVTIQIEGNAFMILEPPGPENNWKKLSLRSLKRIRGPVVIKWGVR